LKNSNELLQKRITTRFLIAYLAAAFIGAQQFLASLASIQSGNRDASVLLLSLQMISMCLAGVAGYYFHIKGKVYSEFTVIFIVIGGMISVISGSVVIAFSTPPSIPFIVSMGGMGIALGIFLCVELIERCYKIQVRKNQLRTSKKEREKAARRSPKEIAREAQEIVKSLEA
jgi:hypothetical protein